MSTIKLNQIVAIEKGVKSRVYGEVTSLHKKSQKDEPYAGFSKMFEVMVEDEPSRPMEEKLVQLKSKEVLARLEALLTESFDVIATKDFGNMVARSDVTIADEVLLPDVPVPHLIFLEKQLNDIQTFIEKMPVLPQDTIWTWDKGLGLFVAPETYTNSTRKTPKVIVKYDATEHHPAQTDVVAVDVTVGRWKNQRFSGAMEPTRKQELLDKVATLKQAVQKSREQANMQEVERVNTVGKTVFNYLFS
jgi:hypothetical protein